jgi:hypothetical protein
MLIGLAIFLSSLVFANSALPNNKGSMELASKAAPLILCCVDSKLFDCGSRRRHLCMEQICNTCFQTNGVCRITFGNDGDVAKRSRY